MLAYYRHNFNGWKAVAHSKTGDQHLVYMGHSIDNVKKNLAESFHEILTLEEQDNIIRISLERWVGPANRGKWVYHESLKIPKTYFKKI